MWSKHVLCCSTVYYISSDKAYLYLCIVIRLIAGCGTAVLYVSANSILLKTTSYNTNTIAVSIFMFQTCHLNMFKSLVIICLWRQCLQFIFINSLNVTWFYLCYDTIHNVCNVYNICY